MMKSIKVILIILILGIFAYTARAQKRECDRSCINEVKSLIKLKENGSGFSSGTMEKTNLSLGDRVGIALLHIYTRHQLTQAKNIRAYLPIVMMSFERPDLIDGSQFRHPYYSLRVLDSILTAVVDRQLRGEIVEARNFVKVKTGLIVEKD